MATSSHSDKVILSRPFPVEWAGFRSDTFTLQRQGWRLAIQYAYYGNRMQLAMQHREMRLYALTMYSRFDRYPSEYLRPDIRDEQLPPFCVRYVSPEIEVTQIRINDEPLPNYFDSFSPIDARPQWVDRSTLSTAQIFAVGNTAAEEIFVQQADMTVIEHLQAIKKLQAPIQREIRENDRRREFAGRQDNAVPQSKVLANVIQLVA